MLQTVYMLLLHDSATCHVEFIPHKNLSKYVNYFRENIIYIVENCHFFYTTIMKYHVQLY